ncbi:MAG: GTP pyrophosphokinase [Clostridiales bacterium]|nr:GTP pyrophosphokinase [Clostridiales bacterium]
MKKDVTNTAMEIAKSAHKNKVDKKGNPYVDHSVAISGMLKRPEEKVVAILHDVYESGDIDFSELKEKGFSDKIIEALDAIIEKSDESYADYVMRIKKNKIAFAVKIADLTYHSNLGLIPNPAGKDFKHSRELKTMKQDLESKKRARELISPFTSDETISKR